MFPSKKNVFPVIFIIGLFLSANGFAQVISDSTLLSKKASPVLQSTSEDTLIEKNDTTAGIRDTSAAARDTVAGTKDTLDIITDTDSFNTIPGFRVQIGSTADLSAAVAKRAQAETLLAGYNVYIIYDSPYYKVRAGDFRSRYDASQAASLISSRGFSQAWVVPDNVFRNPTQRNK